MRYRLKKDLPEFDKGTIIKQIYHNSGTKECYITFEEVTGCTTVETNINIPYKKLFDWIEEIKPREFWCCKNSRDERFWMYPSPKYDGCIDHWPVAIKVQIID